MENKKYEKLFLDLRKKDWDRVQETVLDILPYEGLSSLLKTLEKSELKKIGKNIKLLTYSKKDDINIDENAMYFLLSGKIELKNMKNKEHIVGSSPYPFIFSISRSIDKLKGTGRPFEPNCIYSGDFFDGYLINYVISIIEDVTLIKIEEFALELITRYKPEFKGYFQGIFKNRINDFFESVKTIKDARRKSVREVFASIYDCANHMFEDSGPNAPDDFIRLARSLFRDGKDVKAGDCYKKAGDFYREKNVFGRALALYKVASYVNPDSNAKKFYNEMIKSHPAVLAANGDVNIGGSRLYLALLSPEKIMAMMNKDIVTTYSIDEGSKNKFLIMEGERASKLFLIQKGFAISHSSATASPYEILKEGDFVCDISLFDNTSCKFSVITKEKKLSVHVFEQNQAESFIKESPEILFFIDELFDSILKKVESNIKGLEHRILEQL